MENDLTKCVATSFRKASLRAERPNLSSKFDKFLSDFRLISFYPKH